uniref:Ig-like domain-containing protein n=1 Tax=Sinocyclocheilus rhinocerous TaxID=307959 RepID=A0A673M643_9TELE
MQLVSKQVLTCDGWLSVFSLSSKQYLYAFILCSSMCLTGTQAECPVQLNPQRAVVRYGDSVAVNCSASVPHKGMGWEASEGAVTMTRDSLITWRVSNLIEWDIQPYCYINHEEQCQVELPVTIYKTPDSVSISIVNHRGPMIEGKQYELQCDVHDVAPVQNLTVKWYKGQTLLNQTTFTEDSKTPVNETTTLLIRPDRADDGAQYRCEADVSCKRGNTTWLKKRVLRFFHSTALSLMVLNSKACSVQFPCYLYFLSFHSQKYLINVHSSLQISEFVNLPPQRLQTVCRSSL